MSAFLISVPLTIFVIFVAPLWLWLHYGGKRQTRGQLSSQHRKHLETLLAESEHMQQRIHALEAILDAENPEWRHIP